MLISRLLVPSGRLEDTGTPGMIVPDTPGPVPKDDTGTPGMLVSGMPDPVGKDNMGMPGILVPGMPGLVGRDDMVMPGMLAPRELGPIAGDDTGPPGILALGISDPDRVLPPGPEGAPVTKGWAPDESASSLIEIDASRAVGTIPLTLRPEEMDPVSPPIVAPAPAPA